MNLVLRSPLLRKLTVENVEDVVILPDLRQRICLSHAGRR